MLVPRVPHVSATSATVPHLRNKVGSTYNAFDKVLMRGGGFGFDYVMWGRFGFDYGGGGGGGGGGWVLITVDDGGGGGVKIAKILIT